MKDFDGEDFGEGVVVVNVCVWDLLLLLKFDEVEKEEGGNKRSVRFNW